MHQDFFTYKECDSAFYEAMRINKGSSSGWSADKEGNALIDTNRTDWNVEVVPHHEALNPSNYRKHNRGQGLAEYHKQVCGRSARMNGDKKQQSKVVGCVITLPREEYEKLGIKVDLTDEEWATLTKHIESGSKREPKSKEYKQAIAKLKNVDFTPEQREYIENYLTAAFRSWQKNAGIKDEDVLFAVLHYDETTPHLHTMAFPSAERKTKDKNTGKEITKKTFSTDRFTNWKTGYMNTMHQNVIKLMEEDFKIDGSNLLNGATKKENAKLYSPAQLTKEQREESVDLALISREAERRAKEAETKRTAEEEKFEILTEQVSSLEEEKGFVENEIRGLEVIKKQDIELGQRLSTAINQSKKNIALYQSQEKQYKEAVEAQKSLLNGQEVEYDAFKSYKINKASYEAQQARLEVQVAKLEGQKEDLKEGVKELSKEIGDVGFVTRAVHNVTNTEKEIQNYDDMMLFARVAMNFLEKKFPKILQEIMNIIEKARGIGTRKNIIQTMQKELEEKASAIEEEWERD